jgi:hypothetical protein
MKMKNSKNRGQTLVEWALILPLLLLIVFTIFDLGRGIYYYSVVYNAAREGARFGIISPCDVAAIKQEVRQRAVALDIPENKINVNWTFPDPDDPVCNISVYRYPSTIIVSVESEFTPATPFVGSFTIRSSSTMKVEG